jgi:hypothetical protein
MSDFLTSKERIAIKLLFEWLDESSANRTLAEYIAIARRVPKLAAVHAYVNQRLAEITAANEESYGICYFKLGDAYPWIADFPRSLSIETVRTAIKKFGIPMLREIASSD